MVDSDLGCCRGMWRIVGCCRGMWWTVGCCRGIYCRVYGGQWFGLL